MWNREKFDSDVSPYLKWGHFHFQFNSEYYAFNCCLTFGSFNINNTFNECKKWTENINGKNSITTKIQMTPLAPGADIANWCHFSEQLTIIMDNTFMSTHCAWFN